MFLKLLQQHDTDVIDSIFKRRDKCHCKLPVCHSQNFCEYFTKSIPPSDIIIRMENTWLPLLIKYHYDSSIGNNISLNWKERKILSYFNGFLQSRIPGILRLLVRLNCLYFFECRLNILHDHAPTLQLFRQLLNEIPHYTNALRYNLQGIRILWPFLFELTDICVSKVFDSFANSTFSLNVLSIISLQKNHYSILFCYEFLLLITDMLNSCSIKTFLKSFWKKKKTNHSTFRNRLITCLTKDSIPIILLNQCFILFSYILYYSILDSIPIDMKIINGIKEKIDELKENKKFQLQKISTKIFSTIKYRLHLTWNFLYELIQSLHTSSSTLEIEAKISLEIFYSKWKQTIKQEEIFLLSNPLYYNEKQENTIFPSECSSLKTYPKDLPSQYFIPCWNRNCNKILCENTIKKEYETFFYCKRCYIASYCSQKCEKSHWIQSHQHDCYYFRHPPTFTRFFLIGDDYKNIVHTFPIACNTFETYATQPVQPWNLRDAEFCHIF